MWPYFALLFFPAMFSLARARLPPVQARFVWFLMGVVIALFVGLRDETGGDWYTYQQHFWVTQQLNFGDAVSETKDPGYYAVSWLIAWLGGDLHVLNLFCATLLTIGTIAFVRERPYPWLGLVAAIPYLILIVGMGYTRQSAAIGCVMIGLVSLGRAQVRRFVFWVLVGATFHKSAILLMPIAALAATKQRLWTMAWVAVTAAIGAWLFLYESSSTLWANYVESEYAYSSEGAGIRVSMNCLAAIVYLLVRRRLQLGDAERKLWNWMSLLSFACVPLLLYSPTAVDRVALYFIPLQLFLFSTLPAATQSKAGRTGAAVLTVAYFTAVQIVWFNFASHARAWLPYESLLGA